MTISHREILIQIANALGASNRAVARLVKLSPDRIAKLAIPLSNEQLDEILALAKNHTGEIKEFQDMLAEKNLSPNPALISYLVRQNGGTRDGSGRKPVADIARKEQISIRLPKWMLDWMDEQGGSKGEMIEMAMKAQHNLTPPAVQHEQ